MSQVDEEMNFSETPDSSEGENPKLVPVTESIRYRKRAQSAEKRIEVLGEQLAQARTETSKMAEQLKSIQMEQELVRKLSAAGTVDLEAAVLIVKAKAETQDGADLDSVIEQLRKEKQYLFVSRGGGPAAQRTTGAKDRMQNTQAVVEKAAKKAATTGNRTDLQEYLKLRRNFV